MEEIDELVFKMEMSVDLYIWEYANLIFKIISLGGIKPRKSYKISVYPLYSNGQGEERSIQAYLEEDGTFKAPEFHCHLPVYLQACSILKQKKQHFNITNLKDKQLSRICSSKLIFQYFPLIAPAIGPTVRTAKVGKTDALIEWEPLSVEEQNGFIKYYNIIYRTATGNETGNWVLLIMYKYMIQLRILFLKVF